MRLLALIEAPASGTKLLKIIDGLDVRLQYGKEQTAETDVKSSGSDLF